MKIDEIAHPVGDLVRRFVLDLLDIAGAIESPQFTTQFVTVLLSERSEVLLLTGWQRDPRCDSFVPDMHFPSNVLGDFFDGVDGVRVFR